MVSELGFMTLDGAAGQTPGKGTWPKLLAWIYKVNDNATCPQYSETQFFMSTLCPRDKLVQSGTARRAVHTGSFAFCHPMTAHIPAARGIVRTVRCTCSVGLQVQ